MQNDFGFTAAEAAQEKYHLMEEAWSNKLAKTQTREERESVQQAYEAVKEKIQKIKECTRLLIYYKEYVTEELWNERFDLPLDLYL